MATTEKASANSTDLEELYSVISGLIGKKCWKVKFTYGRNLSLHFGRAISYASPKLRGRKKGEWIFETLGTPWTLFVPAGVITSKEEDEGTLEEKVRALQGRKVTKITLAVPDNALSISFGADHLFQLVPTRNDARSGVPYWQLFMADHRLVTFGPGKAWSCTRSDDFWDSLVRQTGTETPAEAGRVLRKLAGIPNSADSTAEQSLAKGRSGVRRTNG